MVASLRLLNPLPFRLHRVRPWVRHVGCRLDLHEREDRVFGLQWNVDVVGGACHLLSVTIVL
jgi:hypothetical protein